MAIKTEGTMVARSTSIPAGVLPPEKAKLEGEFEVKIVKVDPEGALVTDEKGEPVLDEKTGLQLIDPEGGERKYVHCEYPDGFVREHQVATVAELLTKVQNQLRGRHGNENVSVVAAPKDFSVNGVFKLGA